MKRVHPYPLVAWRGTLPVDDEGRVAIFLNTPTGVARYSLDERSARHLAESVLDYLTRAQSASSSGNPSNDVSPAEHPNV